jgi:hypothetical protein
VLSAERERLDPVVSTGSTTRRPAATVRPRQGGTMRVRAGPEAWYCGWPSRLRRRVLRDRRQPHSTVMLIQRHVVLERGLHECFHASLLPELRPVPCPRGAPGHHASRVEQRSPHAPPHLGSRSSSPMTGGRQASPPSSRRRRRRRRWPPPNHGPEQASPRPRKKRRSRRRPCGCTARTTRSPTSRSRVRSPRLARIRSCRPEESRAPAPPRGSRLDSTRHHGVARPTGEVPMRVTSTMVSACRH